MQKFINLKILYLISLLGYSISSQAYHLVYSPYVEYGESELEFYTEQIQDDNAAIDGSAEYVLEYAKGVSPKLFLEGKVIATKTPGSDLSVSEYAIEAIYQLTEQGEYSWDYSLFGELVYSDETSEFSELEIALLLAKELTKTLSFTANIIAEYENETSELESGLSAQFKWRLKPEFEPAIEIYSAEHNNVIGPVVTGTLKTGKNKFGYEAGVLFATDDESPDTTIKLLLEYEF